MCLRVSKYGIKAIEAKAPEIASSAVKGLEVDLTLIGLSSCEVANICSVAGLGDIPDAVKLEKEAIESCQVQIRALRMAMAKPRGSDGCHTCHTEVDASKFSLLLIKLLKYIICCSLHVKYVMKESGRR